MHTRARALARPPKKAVECLILFHGTAKVGGGTEPQESILVVASYQCLMIRCP
jgi:hypothetical protein